MIYITQLSKILILITTYKLIYVFKKLSLTNHHLRVLLKFYHQIHNPTQSTAYHTPTHSQQKNSPANNTFQTILVIHNKIELYKCDVPKQPSFYTAPTPCFSFQTLVQTKVWLLGHQTDFKSLAQIWLVWLEEEQVWLQIERGLESFLSWIGSNCAVNYAKLLSIVGDLEGTVFGSSYLFEVDLGRVFRKCFEVKCANKGTVLIELFICKRKWLWFKVQVSCWLVCKRQMNVFFIWLEKWAII